MKKKQNGFIALMSVIIISFVLLLVAVSLSFSSFFQRFNVYDSELKAVSNSLANACADVALLKIANGQSFSPNEIITINSNTCTIKSVTVADGEATILIQASYQNAFTNLKIKVNTSTASITSWTEIPTL